MRSDLWGCGRESRGAVHLAVLSKQQVLVWVNSSLGHFTFLQNKSFSKTVGDGTLKGGKKSPRKCLLVAVPWPRPWNAGDGE